MFLFGFAALLLRRIKKEKRARRRLQEQMGGTQIEESKNIINDAASVTSQESDKHTPGEYNSSPVFIAGLAPGSWSCLRLKSLQVVIYD